MSQQVLLSTLAVAVSISFVFWCCVISYQIGSGDGKSGWPSAVALLVFGLAAVGIAFMAGRVVS